MHIIFDLSGTVFGALDYSLRPGIRETIAALRAEGNTVDFWTSGRTDNYRALLKKSNIPGNVYTKGASLPFTPDVCVDDKPEEWMPGRVFRVDVYVSDVMPVEAIDAGSVLAGPAIGGLLKEAF